MARMKSFCAGLSDFGIAFYPLNPRDPRFFILCVNSRRFVVSFLRLDLVGPEK